MGKKRAKLRRAHDEVLKVPAVLTIDELASCLQLAKSTAYKLAQVGQIPGRKVGRHWRFHRSAIDRWLPKGQGRP